MVSLPDLDSKDSEEEQKTKRHMAVHCLDKDFSEWQDKRISEGFQQWNKHDKMTCDHADPCKEAKSPDPLGLPLDYMVSCGVFEPKKTSVYDLFCFYQVGLSGDLPEFPSPCEPTPCEQVSSLLLNARVLGWPNLIVHTHRTQSLLSAFYRNSTLRTASAACQWRPKQRPVANPFGSFPSALSANTQGATIHPT